MCCLDVQNAPFEHFRKRCAVGVCILSSRQGRVWGGFGNSNLAAIVNFLNRRSYNLQFAINTSKPPAPVALQGRLCLSGKPHEYKRSLVWLNLPDPAKLGIPRARWPPLSISILQR